MQSIPSILSDVSLFRYIYLNHDICPMKEQDWQMMTKKWLKGLSFGIFFLFLQVERKTCKNVDKLYDC